MSIVQALVLAWMTLVATTGSAQSPAVSEQTLRAVLLYKLPLFVYLNNDKRSSIRICTFGDTPLGNALEKLPQMLADGRRIELKSLNADADAGECEFVYFGDSEAGRLESLLRKLNGRRIVSVSGIEGFALNGGMVELALRSDGSGLVIRINRKAAQKQGIEFNAQLLRLARIVEP
jgi:hypothetical protein